MAKTKQRKITRTMQKTAVDILQRLEFTQTIDEVIKVYNDVKEEYGLMFDPFTHTICTPDEWYKSKVEYDRQTMYDRYGHWDGLE